VIGIVSYLTDVALLIVASSSKNLETHGVQYSPFTQAAQAISHSRKDLDERLSRRVSARGGAADPTISVTNHYVDSSHLPAWEGTCGGKVH